MNPEAGTRAAFGAPAPNDAVLRAVAGMRFRQPLGTIESLAYYLGMVVPQKRRKSPQTTGAAPAAGGAIEWILSSWPSCNLVDTLDISPELVDVEELITQSVIALGSGCVPVTLDLPGNLPHVRLDPNLGRALLGNLLILFRQLAKDTHPLSIRPFAAPGERVSLEFFSPATGYRSEAALGPGSALKPSTAPAGLSRPTAARSRSRSILSEGFGCR